MGVDMSLLFDFFFFFCNVIFLFKVFMLLFGVCYNLLLDVADIVVYLVLWLLLLCIVCYGRSMMESGSSETMEFAAYSKFFPLLLWCSLLN